MNNYYYSKIQLVQLLLLFTMSLILCSNLTITPGSSQDAREELESEEFENSLVKHLRDDYRHGFVELVTFIISINNTLMALNTTLAAQGTKLGKLDAKIDALNVEINSLNATISNQDTQFTSLNSTVDWLSTTTNNIIKKSTRKNLTWEDFDVLIRTQGEEIKTGKSFNSSTLSDIKSRATQFGYEGWHTVIVFVNHLDEAIDDFTIYDAYKTIYNPAPNSVPGRTQEVFTFAHPTSGGSEGYASFSYVIPSLNIRIAAITQGGGRGVGLAFVPKGTDMKTYYDSKKGIKGSSVWEYGDFVDRNLSVGYKNFYARMFADNYGGFQATLRIELIEFLLGD